MKAPSKTINKKKLNCSKIAFCLQAMKYYQSINRE